MIVAQVMVTLDEGGRIHVEGDPGRDVLIAVLEEAARLLKAQAMQEAVRGGPLKVESATPALVEATPALIDRLLNGKGAG